MDIGYEDAHAGGDAAVSDIDRPRQGRCIGARRFAGRQARVARVFRSHRIAPRRNVISTMNMKLPHLTHTSHPRASVWKEGLHSIGRDPHMDWTLIVAISIFATAAFVWGAVSTYIAIDEQSSAAASAPSHLPTVNAQALSKALDQSDARAAEHASLLRTYGGAGDPSL